MSEIQLSPDEGQAPPDGADEQTEPDAAEVDTPARSAPLGPIALGLAAAAALSCLLLLIPGWGSSAGPWLTVALAVAGVTLGIIALERRSGAAKRAVAAVALAAVAGIVTTAGALPQPDLWVHVYGYKDCPWPESTTPSNVDPEAYMTGFYAPDYVGVDTVNEPSLSFGTSITINPTSSEGYGAIATLTVDSPIDVTNEASSPPAHGRYIAVPITVEAANGGLACYGWRGPGSWWWDYSGGDTDYTEPSIQGYPTLNEGGRDNGDGTLTYYDIFDVTAGSYADGGFGLEMVEPDGTFRPIFWEEAP